MPNKDLTVLREIGIPSSDITLILIKRIRNVRGGFIVRIALRGQTGQLNHHSNGRECYPV